MDYEAIASAILAEVGLSFDDVIDIGRDWVIGAGPFEQIIGKPRYRGSCRFPNRSNKMSRQNCTISVTGPFDCDEMIQLLAHECGHAKYGWSSLPDYVHEYHAEVYSYEAFQRHLGRPVPDHILIRGKRYVKAHCAAREASAADAVRLRGWNQAILDWCGYEPKIRGEYEQQR